MSNQLRGCVSSRSKNPAAHRHRNAIVDLVALATLHRVGGQTRVAVSRRTPARLASGFLRTRQKSPRARQPRSAAQFAFALNSVSAQELAAKAPSFGMAGLPAVALCTWAVRLRRATAHSLQPSLSSYSCEGGSG